MSIKLVIIVKTIKTIKIESSVKKAKKNWAFCLCNYIHLNNHRLETFIQLIYLYSYLLTLFVYN